MKCEVDLKARGKVTDDGRAHSHSLRNDEIVKRRSIVTSNVRHERHGAAGEACRGMSAQWRGWASCEYLRNDRCREGTYYCDHNFRQMLSPPWFCLLQLRHRSSM